MMAPNKAEYPDYFSKYVDLSQQHDPISVLKSKDLLNYISGLDAQTWNYSYAEGKWTIKEMVLHLIDSERIFNYRALRFARNDATVLTGFDQDTYVPNSAASERSAVSLIREYNTVRDATISLFEGFNEEHLSRLGKVGETSCSVNALQFIIAGHEMHHVNLLNERYLSKDA